MVFVFYNAVERCCWLVLTYKIITFIVYKINVINEAILKRGHIPNAASPIITIKHQNNMLMHSEWTQMWAKGSSFGQNINGAILNIMYIIDCVETSPYN